MADRPTQVAPRHVPSSTKNGATQAVALPQPGNVQAESLPSKPRPISPASPTTKQTTLALPDASEELPEEYKDLKTAMMNASYDASPMEAKTPANPKSPTVRTPHGKSHPKSPFVKSPKTKTPKSKTAATKTPTTPKTARALLAPTKPGTVAQGSPAKAQALDADNAQMRKGDRRMGGRKENPAGPPTRLQHMLPSPGATAAGGAVTPKRRRLVEDQPPPEKPAAVAVAPMLRTANPFQNVPLYKPPLLPRASMWSPTMEAPMRRGLDDGPDVLKNYVHGPQHPMPPDDLVSTRQAVVLFVLIFVFLGLFAAWMRLVEHGANVHHDMTDRSSDLPDRLSITAQKPDDSVIFLPSIIELTRRSATDIPRNVMDPNTSTTESVLGNVNHRAADITE